jgi:hypothetical protein
MAADTAYLNRPISGMSLTTEPGNRPWEKPPQLVTVEDAIEYYTKRILDPETHDNTLDVLETGLPVANLANILTKTSVMNGVHTIDVGVLVTPVIEELIKVVADIHGVPFIPSFEELVKKNTISSREAKKIVREVSMAKNKPAEAPAQESVEPKGLMAKPTKAMGE